MGEPAGDDDVQREILLVEVAHNEAETFADDSPGRDAPEVQGILEQAIRASKVSKYIHDMLLSGTHLS